MWRTGRILKSCLLQVPLTGLGFIWLQPSIASPSPQKNPTQSDPPSQVRLKKIASPELFRQLPITFEPNVGQADTHAQFLSHTGNAVVSFGREGVLVKFPSHFGSVRVGNDRAAPISQLQSLTRESESLMFHFSGANTRSEIEALDPLPTKTNYYVGRDSSRWHTDIANYGRIHYYGLYPGIDLMFHGEKGSMEYDFIIAPGADPEKIRLKVRGSRKMRLSAGSLVFETAEGELRFAKPVVYQERNGIRTNIPGRFAIVGPEALGFRVGPYDHAIPLVIDPVLTYATLLGEGSPGIVGVAVDSMGKIHLAGSSSLGVSFARLNAAGTSLDYVTYLGGTSIQSALGFKLDSNDNTYVLGTTSSPDFATTPGSFRAVCPQPTTGCPFVVKFNPAGALVYSTILSPGANARALAVDTQGNTYITGGMNSSGLDVVNAFEPQYQGMTCTECGDAFVQELNSSGTALVYSTYLAGVSSGPNVSTIGMGIAVDSNGSAYVTGNSGATDFPTKNISLTLNSGHGIFLVKFKPDGSDLVYSASISGSGTDTSTGIALDPSGNAYIIGTAGSTDFPVTPSAYSASCVPVGSFLCFSSLEAIALKVSADGSSLVYSTLLGPWHPYGIAVDANGQAYLNGGTGQSSFLPTMNAVQLDIRESPASPPTAAVMALDSSGVPFFSTLVGGAGGAIAFDAIRQKIVVAGSGGDIPIPPTISDIPLVNPDISICCGGQGYVATIDLSASGPMLSVYPRYDPYLIIRNVGSDPLNISSFASTDPAPLGGDCLTAPILAPGNGCVLVAGQGRDPIAEPFFTLTVSSNSNGGPQQFRILQGTGYGSPRGNVFLVASTTQLYFPAQLVGTSSAPQSVRLTNVGDAPATIVSISASTNAITQTNDCPAVLVSAAGCTIQVTSTPTDPNLAGGVISISHELSNQQIGIYVNAPASANALAVSTTSIQFGTEHVGLAYPSRTLVVTNISPMPIILAAPTIVGPYSQSTNCPSPLATGASCRFIVTFIPTGNGNSPGSITIFHNSVGGSQTVQLDGTGLIRSDLAVSPLQVIFPGATIIGATAGPVIVTLQNTITSTLTISNISITPSVFNISGNMCAGALLPAATCTLNILFTPVSTNPVTGTLTIVHNGFGSPQIIPLSGTGTTQLTIAGETNFGNQEVGSTGIWHYISASNLSFSTPVIVTSASVTGDFQIAQNPCTTIPGGYGCAFQLTFTPTATGLRTGVFTLTASDSPSPHQIALTGNGVSAGLEVSPVSLSFGTTIVGSSTASQSLTIGNASGGPATLQPISISGPFQQSNNCGTTLAFGAACTVQVSFSPTATGNVIGTLTVQDVTDGKYYSAALSGTGTGTAVKLSPGNVLFINQALGTTSSVKAVVLTNQMSSPLLISAITATGDFAQTNNCGSSLAAGASCTINASFQPAALGLRSGSIAISDNAAGSPQSVVMSGNGTAPPTLSISPTVVDFGGGLVNHNVSSQTIALTVTNAPLTISGISVTSSLFNEQDLCSPGFAPGNPCLVHVSFQPTALGPVSATLNIQDDAAGSPQGVQLKGMGTHYTLLQADGGGQIITAGQLATFGVNLNSIPGLSETISVSCSGAPPLSTCNLVQSSFPLNGNPQLFQVTVKTTSRTAISFRRPTFLSPKTLDVLSLGGFLVFCVSLVLLLSSKAQLASMPVRALRIFSMAIAIGIVLGILSCGSGAGGGSGGVVPPPTGTPAGQYVIVITGTSSNPANPPQTVQLSFTVQ